MFSVTKVTSCSTQKDMHHLVRISIEFIFPINLVINNKKRNKSLWKMSAAVERIGWRKRLSFASRCWEDEALNHSLTGSVQHNTECECPCQHRRHRKCCCKCSILTSAPTGQHLRGGVHVEFILSQHSAACFHEFVCYMWWTLPAAVFGPNLIHWCEGGAIVPTNILIWQQRERRRGGVVVRKHVKKFGFAKVLWGRKETQYLVWPQGCKQKQKFSWTC